MSDLLESTESDLSDRDALSDKKNDYDDFFIVEFIKRGPKTKKSIDIVYKTWLSCNRDNGKLVAKFMKPQSNKKIQYTAEDIKLIHDLVKLKSDAPEDWPSFNCKIRGRAKSYEDAKKKLEALHYKEDIFTTESNMEPDQKRQEIEKSLKKKALQEKFAQTQKLMTANPTLPTTTEFQENHKPVSNTNRLKSRDSTKRWNTKNLERVMSVDISERQNAADCIEDEIDVPDKIVNTVDQVIEKNKTNLEVLSLGKTSSTLSDMSVFSTNISVQQDDEIQSSEGSDLIMKELIEMEFRLTERITDMDSRCTNKLAEMDSRLTTVQTGIGQIIASLDQRPGEVIPQGTTFADKYSITLPCMTMDDLTALNTSLESNSCHQEFNNLINAGVDVVGGLSKSTNRILKICLRRQVALKLTAIKQMPNKVRIKEMPFAKIIESVLKRSFPVVTEKNIWSAIGDALSNSKDWEGYRKKREKKNNETAARTEENSDEG